MRYIVVTIVYIQIIIFLLTHYSNSRYFKSHIKVLKLIRIYTFKYLIDDIVFV